MAFVPIAKNAATFDASRFAQTFGVSRETIESLEVYADLLIKWQQRINLIADSTAPEIWWRHFADSAQLARFLPDPVKEHTLTIADIGSGAGFPGLVIALMAPMFHVKLIETNAKKAAFLQEVVARTGARNAEIVRERAETLKGWTADVLTARACAALTILVEMTEGIRGPDTVCLFLKGATAERELTEAREAWKMTVQSTSSVTNPDSVILTISEVSRVR